MCAILMVCGDNQAIAHSALLDLGIRYCANQGLSCVCSTRVAFSLRGRAQVRNECEQHSWSEGRRAGETCEEALLDSTALRRFVDINLGWERAPDGTTLSKFRRLLEEYELGAALSTQINHTHGARPFAHRRHPAGTLRHYLASRGTRFARPRRSGNRYCRPVRTGGVTQRRSSRSSRCFLHRR